jgi:hypothetical protein
MRSSMSLSLCIFKRSHKKEEEEEEEKRNENVK